MLVSGIYLCFNPVGFGDLIPHVLVRMLLFILIVGLSIFSRKYASNQLLLFVRNLYPLLFLGFFYTETSFMKNIVFPNHLDPYFIDLEFWLWNCQPSLEFSKYMQQGWFNEMMNIFYFSYYLLIGAVCIMIYLHHPGHSQKAVFVVVFSFYLYYIIFALLPVVGPQYFFTDLPPDVTPPYFFGKLMHNIIVNYEQPTGAFPSSHVGIAIVVAYAAYRYYRKLFYVILPFVLGICFATVYLKAHYVVDVLAGMISAPVFIILSLRVYNKFLSFKHNKNQEIN